MFDFGSILWTKFENTRTENEQEIYYWCFCVFVFYLINQRAAIVLNKDKIKITVFCLISVMMFFILTFLVMCFDSIWEDNKETAGSLLTSN